MDYLVHSYFILLLDDFLWGKWMGFKNILLNNYIGVQIHLSDAFAHE